MAIPDFQSLMLPVLLQSSNGEVRIGDVVNQLALDLGLSEAELAELLPSGKQTTFANRVHWAKSFLKQAGLVEATRRAYFKITNQGKDVLKSGVDRIDVNYLKRFSNFVDFQNRTSASEPTEGSSTAVEDLERDQSQTPEARIRFESSFINATLATDLLERLLAESPSFFERKRDWAWSDPRIFRRPRHEKGIERCFRDNLHIQCRSGRNRETTWQADRVN